MARLTLGDRIAAAAVGAFVGAFVGLGLAWVAGSPPSRPLHVPHEFIDFKPWILGGAGIFAFVGLVFGPVVGTLLGKIIEGLFASQSSQESPGWLTVLLLAAVLGGAWWWLSR